MAVSEPVEQKHESQQQQLDEQRVIEATKKAEISAHENNP